ncbi:hypothetical protein [Streptomyces sp. BK205]|uniref:hypothetical protein n=1 Tax=Streptomyces sp. BK205 TaxID=2512164 RepID=UPI0010EEE8CC|nr:hypothetical protein [Streptomyces sp. BK205]TCR11543.1 hypothetical protein EV578_12449 [Streptomyces sp. BK205]
MPRGRHRHSPPLHRLLPPSAIAGVSLLCAFGPWLFSQQAVLRVIAAFAAAVAVVGAAVMRRWDAQAGKQVADLTRARASEEWRHEERVAELETDLEESRELRTKLEQRLRAKRAELAGLRNEHAALLRRYATAETERASALEGRRLLEIEAAPERELPSADGADAEAGSETGTGDVEVAAEAMDAKASGTADAKDAKDKQDENPERPAVFSPEGSRLWLRADAALKRLHDGGDGDGEPGAEADEEADADAEPAVTEAETEAEPTTETKPETTVGTATGTDGKGGPTADAKSGARSGAKSDAESDAKKADAKQADAKTNPAAEPKSSPAEPEPVKATARPADAAGTEAEAAQEDEARGKPEAVDGHERAAATTPARAAQPPQRPAGHFIAPTAVAVVPTAPERRPRVEGGFDFFGTKGASSEALEAVQNEDLADVVGQEALALHKAESEAEFKPADEESRGVGQVIDLTAHDETEQINLKGLRSAVS